MHDRNRCIAEKDPVEPGAVEHVAFFEWSPYDRPAITIGEVIVGDRHVASLAKRLANMRADVAGPAGDKHCWSRVVLKC